MIVSGWSRRAQGASPALWSGAPRPNHVPELQQDGAEVTHAQRWRARRRARRRRGRWRGRARRVGVQPAYRLEQQPIVQDRRGDVQTPPSPKSFGDGAETFRATFSSPPALPAADVVPRRRRVAADAKQTGFLESAASTAASAVSSPRGGPANSTDLSRVHVPGGARYRREVRHVRRPRGPTPFGARGLLHLERLGEVLSRHLVIARGFVQPSDAAVPGGDVSRASPCCLRSASSVVPVERLLEIVVSGELVSLEVG